MTIQDVTQEDGIVDSQKKQFCNEDGTATGRIDIVRERCHGICSLAEEWL